MNIWLSEKFVRVGSYTIQKKSIKQSDKSASTIGSNACKSVLILMGINPTLVLEHKKHLFDY